MHLVIIKHENRIEYSTGEHRGSEPIERWVDIEEDVTAEWIIEYLKDLYQPETVEIIEA